jgi:hypothetical protein
MTPRNISITINILAVIAPAWFLFFHQPYVISFITTAMVPLVAIAMALVYKRNIGLDTDINSVGNKSSLLFVMITPGLALLLRSVFDFEVLSYKNIWISTAIVWMLLSILISFTSVNLKTAYGRASFASVALFMSLFSFGVCKISNCALDSSEPTFFKAFIGSRNIARGSKSTAIPSVSLNFPGYENNPETVVIPPDMYHKLKGQDSVVIEQHTGLLRATWYKVTSPR